MGYATIGSSIPPLSAALSNKPEPGQAPGSSELMPALNFRGSVRRSIIASKSEQAKTAKAEANVDAETIEFTPDEIKVVKAAIRRARQGMAEWNTTARVDPDKMRRPLTR